ncbi:MAG: ABC transporter permease subunit [Actinobacteria bacterium]|nr:ABC transporter permease subunit [Actinomycetota bacterium]
MSAVVEVPVAAPVASRVPWWKGRLVRVAVIAAVLVVVKAVWAGDFPWPGWIAWEALSPHLDRFQTWLIDERTAGDAGFVFDVFNGFRSFLDWLVEHLNSLLRWITWPGLLAAGTLIVWRFGGVKAAGVVLAMFGSFAALGFWSESVETLALMLAAVALSLVVGIPLGVAAGRSRRVDAALRPLLDAAQIVPAFAYLMPVTLLFSIGYAAGVVVTMVYAIPPTIRITALGIRRVPVNTVEAAESLGATRRQVLGKVQLPLARGMVMLGVNQTILFALSMVVIAGMIGGGGIGAVVYVGITRDPALALLAGVAIVAMAMALDRVTQAIAERADPAKRRDADETRARRRLRNAAVALAVGATVVVAKILGASGAYPLEAGARETSVSLQDWLLGRLNGALSYIQDPTTFLFHVLNPTATFVLQKLVLPLQSLLVEAPWFATLAALTLIAFVVSGLRPAIATFVAMSVIGVAGVWAKAMDTFSQVLVATLFAVVIGVVLGVAASESRAVALVLRPVNDVLQTLPQLIYLVPFVFLLNVSLVPGIVAGVLYAFPAVVRLVERGLRDVAPQAVQAAASFGATRRQVLFKVRIPQAGDAIMLGVNQGIIMVLAVVVIGGLVGSSGLGYDVAQGLVRGNFGEGVIASLGILSLGIALDRVTQGSRRGVGKRQDD